MKSAKKAAASAPKKTRKRVRKPKAVARPAPAPEPAPEPAPAPEHKVRLRDQVVVSYGASEIRGQVVYLGEAFDVAATPGGSVRSDGRRVPEKGWINASSRWQYLKTPFEQGGLYTICRGVIVRGKEDGKVRYWAPWTSQVRKEAN